MTVLKSGLALAAWVGICLVVGWIGAQVTRPALIDWYPALDKPSWTPPDQAFPIVWTALYLLMGIAAWVVWERLQADSQGSGSGGLLHWLPLLLFAVQLVLNALWSALFFGARAPSLAFAEILLLLAAIIATIIAFGRISGWAALLLVPYLLWVAYAAALNFAVWRMNP